MGGIRLDELEESLRGDPLVQWVRLRVIPGQGLAVGWYRHRGQRPKQETVCGFTAVRGRSMTELALSIRRMEGTARTFRKDQRKIATWYFKDLCRTFRDGVLVMDDRKKSAPGRRD